MIRSSGGKIYKLYAETDQEVHAWVQCIKGIIRDAKQKSAASCVSFNLLYNSFDFLTSFLIAVKRKEGILHAKKVFFFLCSQTAHFNMVQI